MTTGISLYFGIVQFLKENKLSPQFVWKVWYILRRTFDCERKDQGTFLTRFLAKWKTNLLRADLSKI